MTALDTVLDLLSRRPVGGPDTVAGPLFLNVAVARAAAAEVCALRGRIVILEESLRRVVLFCGEPVKVTGVGDPEDVENAIRNLLGHIVGLAMTEPK